MGVAVHAIDDEEGTRRHGDSHVQRMGTRRTAVSRNGLVRGLPKSAGVYTHQNLIVVLLLIMV